MNQLCRWAWNQATGPTETATCSGTGFTPPNRWLGSGAYWSSSEGNQVFAWYQSFGTGRQDGTSNLDWLLVRPVRAFRWAQRVLDYHQVLPGLLLHLWVHTHPSATDAPAERARQMYDDFNADIELSADLD